MAAITIAATALDLTDYEEGAPILIGEESRAYAGNQRNSVRGQKRAFRGVTIPYAEATWDTIRAACANRAQVTVSGIALSGDSITASLEVSAKPAPGLSTDFWMISFVGQQV